MFLLIFAALAISIAWLFWKLIGRPLAFSLGLVRPSAHDWEVVGWNAERDGRTMEALEAYDEALLLEPNNETVKSRRDNLLQLDDLSSPED